VLQESGELIDQRRLADPGRRLDHDQRARALRSDPARGGAQQLQLGVALDERRGGGGAGGRGEVEVAGGGRRHREGPTRGAGCEGRAGSA
jgi:hypothetical protein